jgi:hypothetical protein
LVRGVVRVCCQGVSRPGLLCLSALAGRESSGLMEVERPEAGGEGSVLVRAEEVREARVGVGSKGLVRWGRKEKVTGKERAWEAAALAAEKRAAGERGQCRETKRESLMVSPVVQQAACSAERAAARAQSSRWPRQRETGHGPQGPQQCGVQQRKCGRVGGTAPHVASYGGQRRVA